MPEYFVPVGASFASRAEQQAVGGWLQLQAVRPAVQSNLAECSLHKSILHQAADLVNVTLAGGFEK